MTYYNDWDKPACAWLRELMAKGLIPKGDVDDRSICDVTPGDVSGYDQCHFFAGIGGFPLALQYAGVPGLKGIWTGSCPCPSFSSAGKGKGFDDPRHRWPEFYRLIRQCHPPVVLGEQVENAIKYGWLDLVSADLQDEGYAVSAAVLSACGLGAPHQRKRLWWGGILDSPDHRGHKRPHQPREPGIPQEEPERNREAGCVGNPLDDGPPPRRGEHSGETEEWRLLERQGPGFWDDVEWVPCRDGKYRPIEPGLMPVADGVPERVGRIRGFGNAIVPQVGARFIRAFLGSAGDCN